MILFYFAASAKGAENEPWLVPAIANVKRKESWNMQLERLYQSLWLFFPLRLHLGYSVALLAIAWWDPWWSLHEKTCPASSWCATGPFDLSLRPIFKIHYGLISRQNLSTQPWSTWVCDPVTGTRWPRNGRRRSTGWSGSPNHLCTDISDTSYTPRKMKPVPRPTTPASATTCQFMISRMMSTSSMFRWGAVALCSFVLLQTSNPAKTASCNSVLALINSIILLHFGKGSYEASWLALAGNHSSQTGKCDFPLSTVPPCFYCSPTHFNSIFQWWIGNKSQFFSNLGFLG